ncbi:MAG: adenylate/guanylate cyclase domain-containing protein [Solirubrobacteraceae bacterium]
MEPPVGIVTMVFTDIEGSTRLATALGSSWPDALALHHRILRGAIERHHGYVADTDGDAFFACFANPRDAITAVRDAQRELTSASWPTGLDKVKVRMGVHTGYIEHREVGYVGLEIHRAARVGAAANGGQVLLTGVTEALLRDDDVALEYVGEHRLKDFPRSEALFHLVIDEGGAGDFPKLRTAISRPTNLREDLRALVGRAGELDQLCALVRRERLVSVVGAGGAGKTRLALAAARLLLDELEGGAFVVSLASVTEPNAMLEAIVRALELRGLDGAPAEQIAARVGNRPTLLVLDNFEQLLSAAPLVAQLAADAPQLRVLVTSQAALRVGGEVVMGLDALELEAAADLFVQLAQDAGNARPTDAESREAILEICRRVGCLPLAVELAAARVSVLAPAQLLARLERSSDILRGVARDAPDRQRSLRATFEWTYGLLALDERVLFGRLGAFSGPVGLDAIEAICGTPEGDDPVPVLDALEGLLEFSLIRREQSVEHGRRFTMPQALRDFARAELEVSSEAEAARRHHAEHVLKVADAARVWFTANPAATASVLALEAEIRPALAWASAHDPELYRRLVCALALGLIRRGYVAEALGHATRACAPIQEPIDEIEAWVGNCKAYALEMSGRLEEGETAIKPVIAFYRTAEHPIGLGLALHTAGWLATDVGDEERSLELGRESLELLRSTGDQALIGRALGFLIEALLYRGAFEEAEQLLAEAAASIPDPESDLASIVTTTNGDLALARGDIAAALTHFADSLELAARRRDGIQMINDAHCIAYALACAGHHEAAVEAEGTAAAIAADGGHSAVYNWAARGGFDSAAMIGQARDAIGQTADRLEAHGRDVPPGERVAHLLTLARTAEPDSGTARS